MQSGWLGLYLMERAIARYKHGRSIPPSSNIVHVLLQVNGPFNYSNSVNGAVQVSSFHLKKNLLQKSATPFFLAEEVVILKNCHWPLWTFPQVGKYHFYATVVFFVIYCPLICMCLDRLVVYFIQRKLFSKYSSGCLFAYFKFMDFESNSWMMDCSPVKIFNWCKNK